jgi:rod shape-determining protein MreC
MRGVPVRGTIAPGTEIVTSGLGGTFPRGIPIGIVMGEAQTSELWARTYLLRPAVLPSAISAVMVLIPARADSGVAGVWQTGEGMRGATSTIVDAGDSLARAAALRLRAAERASDSSGERPGADTLR